MRKRFTPSYKAQVVRELLREEKTLAQISTEYGMAATQLSAWKATALKGLSGLFEIDDPVSLAQKNLESPRSRTERVQMLDWESDELTLRTQAELLG